MLRRSGPVDVLALAAQAVTMGDDVHVRTQAATNLLIKEWLPHLAGTGGGQVAAFARFLAANHLFFLTLAMAAARSLTEWAAGVPDSSIVTSMSRNGTTFGIRLAGLAAVVHRRGTRGRPRALPPGAGPGRRRRDIGDSAVLELCGLGAAAAAGSPAVAQLLGGSMGAAAALTERLAAVCAGRSSRFKIPVLGNVGTPLGVDVRKVAELGTTPAVTTGILHRSAGTGQVGAGVAEAPLACFADALTDLDQRLTVPRRGLTRASRPEAPATKDPGGLRASRARPVTKDRGLGHRRVPGRSPRAAPSTVTSTVRRGGEGVGHVTGPQGGLDERFDLLGGKLRADAELEPGEARPVVGTRGGDGQPGHCDAPLARRPLQRQGVTRRHRGQQVLGRHRPGPGTACARRLIHHELEPARLDPAAPAALPPGHHRVGMRAPRAAVGSHGWRGFPLCIVLVTSWPCWPGGATPLEPPAGSRPRSSVTGPWPGCSWS